MTALALDVTDVEYLWHPDVVIAEAGESLVIAGGTGIGTTPGLGVIQIGVVAIGDRTFTVEVARRIAAEILRQSDLVDPEKTGADRDAH